jgi:peptide subunit release factor 1 (eRF1)
MLTFNDVYKLASRPERTEDCVLTIYLDVDQSRQANLNRGFERQLKDMLRSVREEMCNDNERNAFETASHRVNLFVENYDAAARGLCLVFDAFDGFFWSHQVDFPVRNQIRWTREVFVQPLAVALDEYERVAIVLLDRSRVRLLTMFLGELEEHRREDFNHRAVRHIKTVGTDHLGSASRVQRKADEQIRLNLRQFTKDIDALLAQCGVRRIILAGSPEMTAEFRTVLPKRLASQLIGTVDLAMAASNEEIRSATMPIAEKFERASEEALVTDLLTSAAKSRPVVAGLSNTLHALNQRRVWQLVYADGFQAPGYECPKCGALFSLETAACPLCGGAVVGVEDVVERAVGHALRGGAKIEVVRSMGAQSLLGTAGGIGSFLRTRTASVMVS